uniref:Uncharacterized protein n=1 Tax=Aegilops tauschii subsp. strangulata TaxID=200361 RepID=A0A453BYB3_AEGTS
RPPGWSAPEPQPQHRSPTRPDMDSKRTPLQAFLMHEQPTDLETSTHEFFRKIRNASTNPPPPPRQLAAGHHAFPLALPCPPRGHARLGRSAPQK